MKDNLKMIIFTLIVCFLGTFVGALYFSFGLGMREQALQHGQLNVWIIIGYVLIGPWLFAEWLLEFLTNDDQLIYIAAALFQLIAYFAFVVTWRWFGKNTETGIWLKHLLAKRTTKIVCALIFCLIIVSAGLYLHLTSSAVSGKRWLSSYWSTIKNENCKELFEYTTYELSAALRKIKKLSLGEESVRISKFGCLKENLSKELALSMSQEQIEKLQPVDIFCWCRKHFDDFFQGDIDVSFTGRTKALYHYRVVREGKAIGFVTLIHGHKDKWYLWSVGQYCKE